MARPEGLSALPPEPVPADGEIVVERTSPPDPDPSVLWGAIAGDVSHEYPGTLSPLCETCAFSETFIELAGMLVAKFDLMDLLHLLAERCARLVGGRRSRTPSGGGRG
jgi:hypothetical protein